MDNNSRKDLLVHLVCLAILQFQDVSTFKKLLEKYFILVLIQRLFCCTEQSQIMSVPIVRTGCLWRQSKHSWGHRNKWMNFIKQDPQTNNNQ